MMASTIVLPVTGVEIDENHPLRRTCRACAVTFDTVAEAAESAHDCSARYCGACKRQFPTVAEVFGHDCAVLDVHLRRIEADAPPTTDADNVDRDRPAGGGSGGTVDAPSEKQVRFLTALVRGSTIAETQRQGGDTADVEPIVAAVVATLTTKRAVSRAIDKLKDAGVRPVWDAVAADVPVAPVAEAPVERPAELRPNRYAGTCATCGGRVAEGAGSIDKDGGRWIVRHLPTQCGASGEPIVETFDTPDGLARRVMQVELPDVPEGHYAVQSKGRNDLLFVRVDRPEEGRWAGRTFVKMVVGGHPDQPIKGGQAADVLRRILETGVELAARTYGREIGRCCRCNRHLTDETSRQLGIGPECRSKAAWS